MKKRSRVNARKDRKFFSKTADRVPVRNFRSGSPLRGGIRM